MEPITVRRAIEFIMTLTMNEKEPFLNVSDTFLTDLITALQSGSPMLDQEIPLIDNIHLGDPADDDDESDE